MKFECPNCGSNQALESKGEHIQCAYCFSKFLRNELDVNLFNSQSRQEIEKAVRMRNNCDFEEAEEVLENLLSEDENNPQIYLQLLLCDYGVSYVKDNDTISEKPILNRLQRESIFDKPYYKKIQSLLANQADVLNKYNEQLNQIESIRKEALDIANSEDSYEVFICYKRSVKGQDGKEYYTEDSQTAKRLYDKFTKWGLKVFFAEETLRIKGAGRAYEPIIFSALMSAKVFVLVCSSPDNPEYLTSPWVKSEWQRYKKRVETEVDNHLLLMTVLSNGFKPDLLPPSLRGIQVTYLDDEFDKVCQALFVKVLSKEKRSQFKNVVIESEVSSLSVAKEEIKLGKFKSFEETELDELGEADFLIAIGEMKSHTDKGFALAKDKLTRIIRANPNNYDANIAKLKCDLRIDFETSLVKCSLNENVNLKEIANDFIAALSVAGENTYNVRKAYIEMLKNTFKNNIAFFAKCLNDENDPFSLVISTYDSVDEMFEVTKEFQPLLDDAVKMSITYKNDKVISNIKDDTIKTIATKMFRKIYSNCGTEGAKKLFDFYYDIANTCSLYLHNNSLANFFIKEALQIDEYNLDALWICFLLNLYNSTAFELNRFVAEISNKNYRELDIGNLPSIESNENNIFYFVVKSLKGGAKLEFSKGIFYNIYESAMHLLNVPSKRTLAKNILYLFASLLNSSNISLKDKINFLIQSGNRLLIEEEYTEAKRYFEQTLTLKSSDSEARWGIVKCDIKCPTNYSTIFYDGKVELSDLESFRALIYDFSMNHKGEPNVYLEYRAVIENIKYNSSKEKKKKALDYFKFHEKSLLDASNPVDTPLDELVNNIKNGQIDAFNLSAANCSKKAEKNSSASVNDVTLQKRRCIFDLIFGILCMAIAVLPILYLSIVYTVLIDFAVFVTYAIVVNTHKTYICKTDQKFMRLIPVISRIMMVIEIGFVFCLYFLLNPDLIYKGRTAEEVRIILWFGGYSNYGVFGIIITLLSMAFPVIYLFVNRIYRYEVYFSLNILALMPIPVIYSLYNWGYEIGGTDHFGGMTIIGLSAGISLVLWLLFYVGQLYELKAPNKYEGKYGSKK